MVVFGFEKQNETKFADMDKYGMIWIPSFQNTAQASSPRNHMKPGAVRPPGTGGTGWNTIPFRLFHGETLQIKKCYL